MDIRSIVVIFNALLRNPVVTGEVQSHPGAKTIIHVNPTGIEGGIGSWFSDGLVMMLNPLVSCLLSLSGTLEAN